MNSIILSNAVDTMNSSVSTMFINGHAVRSVRERRVKHSVIVRYISQSLLLQHTLRDSRILLILNEIASVSVRCTTFLCHALWRKKGRREKPGVVYLMYYVCNVFIFFFLNTYYIDIFFLPSAFYFHAMGRSINVVQLTLSKLKAFIINKIKSLT